MKDLVLREPHIRSEISELQSQLDNLQRTLDEYNTLLEKEIAVVNDEKKFLQNLLDEANANLKREVNVFFDRKKISSTKNDVLKKISEEFFRKYKSDINPVIESKVGELEAFEIDADFLKLNTFTDVLKFSLWQHSSKKLKLFGQLKITFLALGLLSIIMILFFVQPDGVMRYGSIFCMILIFIHLFWIYSRINFFSEGEQCSFYKKIYCNGVESYVEDQVRFLDSILDAPDEVKKLI